MNTENHSQGSSRKIKLIGIISALAVIAAIGIAELPLNDDAQVGSPENYQLSEEVIPDCAGEPGGNAQVLACGCNDATSCLDCEGVPY
ncbi:MAG TPA: hypothetical protein PLP17_07150, partial [Oligoflexia bacterium]|nr:hypothetical protein [Oligoflexia bacterium]